MTFRELTNCFAQLENASGRLEVYRILGELFHRANSREIAAIAYLCEGRLLPAFSGVEIGIGEHMLIRAMARASSRAPKPVAAIYKKTGDLGVTAEKVLAANRGRSLMVLDVYGQLLGIAKAVGPGSIERKIGLSSALLRSCSSQEARYLVRLIEGKWRIGIGPLTVLEAVARSFTDKASARVSLKRAYNLCSDLGLVLKTARQGGFKGLEHLKVRVGHPLRPMLAERLRSARDIVCRLGKCSVEAKLDGFRCQLHIKERQVEIFSRNLERTTSMFPDLVLAARRQLAGQKAILDGEAVAVNESTGEFYPFQVTVQRKRKHAVEKMAREFPLVLVAFDLLYGNRRDYTRQSYADRRRALEKILRRKGAIQVVEHVIATTPKQLQDFFDRQIDRGLEGIVAKRLDAPYEAGARNFNWIKLKQTYGGQLNDTVDAVIVGYLRGRGMRAKLGIGAVLVSVYDAKTDGLPTIAKVGSGLSEQGWITLRKSLDAIRLSRKAARVQSRITADVWTEPKCVVTVLADQVTRSPVHTCGLDRNGYGLALRFPRMVGEIRKDKSPEDATTVQEIKELYAMQAHTKHN